MGPCGVAAFGVTLCVTTALLACGVPFRRTSQVKKARTLTAAIDSNNLCADEDDCSLASLTWVGVGEISGEAGGASDLTLPSAPRRSRADGKRSAAFFSR